MTLATLAALLTQSVQFAAAVAALIHRCQLEGRDPSDVELAELADIRTSEERSWAAHRPKGL